MTESEKEMGNFFSATATICLSVGSCPSEHYGISESFYFIFFFTVYWMALYRG